MSFFGKVKLSERQKKLLQRLESICKRLESKALPIIPEEVWGFGSFFRGKENPKDIDIAIIISGVRDEYKIFEKIFEESLDRHNRLETPVKSFLKVAKTILNERDFQRLSPIFSEWLDDYSWSVVFGGPMNMTQFTVNPKEITKRMLLKNNPRIQIFQIVSDREDLDRMKAEVKELVWSQSNKDILTNLEKVFSPQKIRMARISELQNFDAQIFSLDTECTIIHNLFHKTLKLRESWNYDEYKDWMEKTAISEFTDISQDTLKTTIDNIRRACPEDPKFVLPEKSTYTETTESELAHLVEAKRVQLKNLHEELTVLRSMLWNTIDHMPNENDSEWRKKHTLEEWIAVGVLQDIPKRVVSIKRIREYLRKFGLPEDRILEMKGWGTNRFQIPQNQDEVIRISKNNMKKEKDAKYRRKINPLIKKIDKNISYYIDYDDNLDPIQMNLFFRHYDDSQNIPPSVSKIISWCKTKGFKIDKSLNWIDAKLKIDLSKFNNENDIIDFVLKKLSN